jgi:hypothetical protein
MTRIPIDDGNQVADETGQEAPREAAAPPGGAPAGGSDDPRRLREERDT